VTNIMFVHRTPGDRRSSVVLTGRLRTDRVFHQESGVIYLPVILKSGSGSHDSVVNAVNAVLFRNHRHIFITTAFSGTVFCQERMVKTSWLRKHDLFHLLYYVTRMVESFKVFLSAVLFIHVCPGNSGECPPNGVRDGNHHIPGWNGLCLFTDQGIRCAQGNKYGRIISKGMPRRCAPFVVRDIQIITSSCKAGPSQLNSRS